MTLWLSATKIQSSENEAIYYLLIFSNITQVKAQQAQISRLAYYDTVTGLPNRVKLTEKLTSFQGHTLLYLDTNNFNYINSAYGVETGDFLLNEIGNRLGQ